MGTLWQDLRYGARILLKQPGLTAIAITALAVSIGANTAIFSAIDALLISPLPIEQMGGLVVPITLREGFDPFGSSFLEYSAYRDRNQSLAGIGIATAGSFNLTGRGEPQRLRGAAVSGSYLACLGTKPVLGRVFTAEEDRPGGAAVAMVSYRFWQKEFAGGPEVLGQSIVLDGRSYTIVGIMPAGFDYPGVSDVWMPLQKDVDSLALTERATTNNALIARLKPGVAVEQADTELKAIARQLETEYPEFRRGWSVRVIPLRQDLLGDLEGRVRRAVFTMMGGVGFLLLICCANVANLQLARGVAREREFALRRALGATRSRLVRQLFAENLILALAGGIGGLLLAYWLVPILARLNPIRGISFAAFFYRFEINNQVLLFVLLLSLVSGVVFGLLPALKGAGADELMPRIKHGDQRGGGIGAGRRWLNGLIVAEIAIAVTLLICGGLMTQSFHRLQHVELGFRPDNLLTMKMVLPSSRYSEYRQKVAFADQILERVRAVSGVSSVGIATNIPLENEVAYDAVFDVEGRPSTNPNDVPITSHRIVSPGYLETIGVTLMRGRLIGPGDRAGTLPVVVVSEEFARQAWPGQDPLGKRVRHLHARQSPWFTVVGVVKNVKEDLFNYRINRPVWYVPYAQVENTFPINLVVRTDSNPTSVAPALEQVVHSIDANQPVSNVMTMNAVLGTVLVTERFGAVLMGTLALCGLLLASIGLYGVMAYSVRQRTGEIGLRVALGAQRKHVFSLIMGSGLKLTGIGVIIGLVAAGAITRLLVSLLFGVSATDTATFATIALVLSIVALAACYWPARAAMRLSPVEALRYE